MSRTLKTLFFITDIGFIIYWLIVFLDLLPKEYLYQDYSNPLLVVWNLSFIPLDILISITGFMSIYFHSRKNTIWLPLTLISLTLTFVSGLQAIGFWLIKSDFDLTWWIPNLYLMIYPLFFFAPLLRMVKTTHISKEQKRKCLDQPQA